MKLLIIIILLGVFWLFLLRSERDRYKNRSRKNKYSTEREPSASGSINSKKSRYMEKGYPVFFYLDKASVAWCLDFFQMEESLFRGVMNNIHLHYKKFDLYKRSGGYRTISAPQEPLLSMQKKIYHNILKAVDIHPSSTGFIEGMSIVDNVNPHLGKKEVLKTDIMDFFGSINKERVYKVFREIGYDRNMSMIFSNICILNNQLPQGAPTSPALSNIIAYGMDKKLRRLSDENNLSYTRYADDLTFSGESIDFEHMVNSISGIMREEGFTIKKTKTRYLPEKKRKIITGISISSGEKLTIPKREKRRLRQIVYFIQSRGIGRHKAYIDSSDPAYLKRVIGKLSYWHSVEPDNKYVAESLIVLKQIEKKSKEINI